MAEALKAAEMLAGQGVSAEVVSFHSIKPLDDAYLKSAVSRFRLLATVEEHGTIGGFGSAISEWCASNQVMIRQLGFGTADEFMHEVGTQQYAREKFGLTSTSIAARIGAALGKT